MWRFLITMVAFVLWGGLSVFAGIIPLIDPTHALQCNWVFYLEVIIPSMLVMLWNSIWWYFEYTDLKVEKNARTSKTT